MASIAIHPCDVLVIGTGGAGVRAAIAAKDAGANVVVVGKRVPRDAHTTLAAGGMNAALGTVDPEDSWQQHFADTILEGYFLGDPRVAELLAREAPDAVHELEAWGCPFARTPDGALDQRYFGAHRYRRTCYVGDVTGKALLDTLVDHAAALEIAFVERHHVSRLLVDDDGAAGALAFDLGTGDRTAFRAKAVVLATGGHTTLWHRNTSRVGENYGEGMALAFDGGCRLMDMELVQFHPTGIVAPPDLAGMLVTEAVRGEGGLLTNAGGERFMARYDPARMELSTRDRVALANYTEIVEGRAGPNGGVFLDVSHRGLDFILEKLPKMYRQFLAFQGVDISKEPMEVAPTAHYSMGGIVVVDAATHATDVPGLFAAGECAAGLHGANRLGGNSLTDIVVFGRRAGEAAAGVAVGRTAGSLDALIQDAERDLDSIPSNGDGSTLREIEPDLAMAMWECCGVLRDADRLAEGQERVAAIGERLDHMGAADPAGLSRLLDLRAGVAMAHATLRGAIDRRETRGCHNRSDFPLLDPKMLVNFHQRRTADGSVAVRPERVPPVPAHLDKWVEQAPELEEAGRLLE